mgnify:CR=1 FL=1
MSDMHVGVILLAVIALLLCWVVAEFQIYSADHSMEEAIKRPRGAARRELWKLNFLRAIMDSRKLRQEKLKEENKTVILKSAEEKKSRKEKNF